MKLTDLIAPVVAVIIMIIIALTCLDERPPPEPDYRPGWAQLAIPAGRWARAQSAISDRYGRLWMGGEQ
jgi:hypothetical protein